MESKSSLGGDEGEDSPAWWLVAERCKGRDFLASLFGEAERKARLFQGEREREIVILIKGSFLKCVV